jgi:SWI/SNF-related matrix-associated actin-dependent regulator 1 of chromatin subfamily A
MDDRDLSTTVAERLPPPAPRGKKYRNFQIEAVIEARRRRNMLIADQMGVGKTVEAIGIINDDESIRKVLIVCPASLRLNWRRELINWLTRRDTTIGVATVKRWSLSDIVICGYDSLKPLHRNIHNTQWDLVICDEAHYLKNPSSRRTLELFGREHKDPIRIRPKLEAKRWILLTGTPIVNRPYELWPLVHHLDPDTFNDKDEFIQKYCGGKKRGQKISDIGEKNLNDLHKLLKDTVMIRRLKQDVLPELPPKIRQLILLPDDNLKGIVHRERVGYRAVQQALSMARLKAELAKTAENPALYTEAVKELRQAEFMSIQQITKLRYETALAKVPLVVEYIHHVLEHVPKVVVFAHHTAVIENIALDFGDAVVTVHGKHETTKRQAAIDRFQTDPKCKVFIGSVEAAGYGHTLTAAQVVVFAELTWTPSSLTQAEDRCIAKGQLILTPSGWRPIETIKIGDEVITGSGRPGTVTDAWSKQSKKLMVELVIEGWMHPLRMTQDHKVLLADNTWKQAEDIRPGDVVASPISTHSTKDTYIAFDEDCRLRSEFDGSWGHQLNGRLIKAPDKFVLDEEKLFTFGYFIGDGFASTKDDKGKFISFSGNTTTKRESLQRCRAWLEKHGLKVNEYHHKNDKGVELRAFSGEFALWFEKQFGVGASGKKIPDCLMCMDNTHTEWLIKGLIASDGYIRNNTAEYVTVSNTLAAQVSRLLINTGYKPTVHIGTTNQYVVGFNTKHGGTAGLVRSMKISFPKRIPPNSQRETVYDITVDKDNTFVVGTTVVHNCHRIGAIGTVLVYHLVLDGSIDATLASRVVEKQETINAALDPGIEAQESLYSLAKAKPFVDDDRDKILETANSLSQNEVNAIHDALVATYRRGQRQYNALDYSIIKLLAELDYLEPAQAALGYAILLKYKEGK